jgi:hypothetical protein
LEAAFHQFVRGYATSRGWGESRTETTHRTTIDLADHPERPGAEQHAAQRLAAEQGSHLRLQRDSLI